MRILMLFLFFFMVIMTNAQLDTNLALFEELSGVRIDTVTCFDDWEMHTVDYPSGRKHDEVRTFVSSGCESGGKCVIRYQHQQYYDKDEETFSMKEGKYLTIKNQKAKYSHYGYWYDNNAKLYRNVKEKTVKNL